MGRFFSESSWTSISAVTAGAFGLPFPLECLRDDETAVEVDWDDELRTLTNP